jgi:hypothetical protein
MTAMAFDFQWDHDRIPSLSRVPDPGDAALQLRNGTLNYVLDMVRLQGIDVDYATVSGILNGGVSPTLVSRFSTESVAQVQSVADAVSWLVDSVQNGVFMLDLDTLKLCNWMLVGSLDAEAGNFRSDTAQGVASEVSGYVEPQSEALNGYLSSGLAALDEVPRIDERALAFVALVIRAQCFRTGNRRTARHMANGYLMLHGYHHLSLPAQYRAELDGAVRELLIESDATPLMTLLARTDKTTELTSYG